MISTFMWSFDDLLQTPAPAFNEGQTTWLTLRSNRWFGRPGTNPSNISKQYRLALCTFAHLHICTFAQCTKHTIQNCNHSLGIAIERWMIPSTNGKRLRDQLPEGLLLSTVICSSSSLQAIFLSAWRRWFEGHPPTNHSCNEVRWWPFVSRWERSGNNQMSPTDQGSSSLTGLPHPHLIATKLFNCPKLPSNDVKWCPSITSCLSEGEFVSTNCRKTGTS